MAFTIPEALKRVQNPFLAMTCRSVVTVDEMSAVIPIEPVAAISYRYNREGTLPTGGAYIADTGATSEESIGTDDVVTVEFRRIVGNMDLDQLALTGGGSTPEEKKNRLLAKKIKATWRKVQTSVVGGGRVTSVTVNNATVTPGLAIDAVVVGPNQDTVRQGPAVLKYVHTGTFWSYKAPGDIEFGTAVAISADGSATLTSHNPSKWVTITVDVSDATANGQVTLDYVSSGNDFDGIEKLIPSGQTLGTAGTGQNYSLGFLDKILHLNKVRSNQYFVMNSALLEKHYAAWRALNGTDPQTTAIPGYTGLVPTYRGVPILRNDFIPNDEADGGSSVASSVYCLSLTPDEGLYLAASSYGSLEDPNNDPRRNPVAGFNIEDVGALEATDAHRIRVRWIGALCLGSELAASRFQAINTA